MEEESDGNLARFGRRSIGLLVLLSGVVFMVLVAGWSAVQVLEAMHSGQRTRAALLGGGALVVLAAWLRVMAVNWRAAVTEDPDPPILPADADDATGVWGVGGPAMREPGNTGTWPQRNFDRRYEQGDR